MIGRGFSDQRHGIRIVFRIGFFGSEHFPLGDLDLAGMIR
jgi:hypothetical protein